MSRISVNLGKAPAPLFLNGEGLRPSDVLGVDFRMPPVERRPQGPAPSRAEPRLLARLAAAGIRTSVEDDSRIFHGHGHALGRAKEWVKFREDSLQKISASEILPPNCFGCSSIHTAKTHYWKFETNISRKGMRGLSPT